MPKSKTNTKYRSKKAQLQAMKKQLKEAFAELKSIKEGKTKGIPLDELLAEL